MHALHNAVFVGLDCWLCRKVLSKLIVKQRNIVSIRRPLTKHDDSSKNYPDSLAYEKRA
jgi:hypothetical protein